MKIAEIMEKNVKTCTLNMNLETVARMMWDNDCGSVPVIDKDRKPIGMITDRDITMSSILNHKPLWDLNVGEVTNNRKVFTCTIDDNVQSALDIMKDQKIRRLPVTSHTGEIAGILSMDDLIVAAENRSSRRKVDLSFDEVIAMLKRVCGTNSRYSVHEKV